MLRPVVLVGAGADAEHRLGGIAEGATPDGEVDYLGFLRGFARQPLVTLRAAVGARRALKGLEAIA